MKQNSAMIDTLKKHHKKKDTDTSKILVDKPTFGILSTDSFNKLIAETIVALDGLVKNNPKYDVDTVTEKLRSLLTMLTEQESSKTKADKALEIKKGLDKVALKLSAASRRLKSMKGKQDRLG